MCACVCVFFRCRDKKSIRASRLPGVSKELESQFWQGCTWPICGAPPAVSSAACACGVSASLVRMVTQR